MKKPEPALNTVTLNKRVKELNLPRRDSFLIKDKIFFKKKPSWSAMNLKRYFLNIPKTLAGVFFWSRSLNKKNRLILTVLIIVVLVFFISLGINKANNQKQLAKQEFNALVAKIEEKQSLIDSYLLYDNEDGAKIVLLDAQALLDTLPNKKKSQQESYNRLSNKLNTQKEKIQKIFKVEEVEKVADLTDLGINGLSYSAGLIYSTSNKAIYKIKPGSESRDKIELESSLNSAYFDDKGNLYYWSNGKFIQFNYKKEQSTSLNIPDLEKEAGAPFRLFNNNLYILEKDKGQIYRYKRSGNGFVSPVKWIKEEINFTKASDLSIDGNIYVLNNNGEVFKLYKGQKQEYKSGPVLPLTSSASKLVAGEKYLYILDSPSKRIIILNKEDGKLVKQYQFDSLQELRDFTIDQEKQELYLLSNNMIYRLKVE